MNVNLSSLRNDSLLTLILFIIIWHSCVLMINGFNKIENYQPVVIQPTQPKIVAKKVDNTQLKCLAKNIFYEASGEEIVGQAAVARVVINRMNHGFGKTPCNVIYQQTKTETVNDDGEIESKNVCQFSWVCDTTGEPNTNSPRFKTALKIAYEVLAYNAYNNVIPNNVLFFHNKTVDPQWAYKKALVIGNHVFYAKNKR